MNKTMKKLVPVIAGAAMIAALTGCGTHNTITETYNGISKITTTQSTDGKEVTTVEYKDKDGNVLDAELGEAAFEAGKNGEQDPLAYVQAQTASAGESSAAEETVAAEEPVVASLTFENESEEDITEMYLVTASSDSWGENILDENLSDGEYIMFKDALTYYPESEFELKFVTDDGTEHEFDAFTIGNLDDPTSVTLTFIQDDGTFSFNVD